MNTSRDGFALIAVLWLVAALALLLTVGMRPARLAGNAAENRIGQARALWAARGCVSLVQARHKDGRPGLGREPVALGPATWCSVERIDWDERINPNLVDSIGLLRVLADSVQVASLLDWIDGDDVPRAAGAEAAWYASKGRIRPRNAPVAAVAELALIRGLEGLLVDSMEALFTVRGDGSLSPDRASARVLASVSVLSDSHIERLIAMRARHGSYSSVESVSLALGMDPTADEFRELALRLSTGPEGTTIRAHGWTDLGGRVVRSRIDLEFVPLDDELALSAVEVM
jgi:general secretion pathway protein K